MVRRPSWHLGGQPRCPPGGRRVSTSRSGSGEERWSGGAPFVMVMQAADVWYLNDGAAGWRLCGPRHRCILVQGKMWAPLVIIGQEESERASKGLLIPHDDMIETLAPQGTNQAFDVRILPRGAGRPRGDWRDASCGSARGCQLRLEGDQDGAGRNASATARRTGGDAMR